jgi:hypothetical protein
VPVDVAAAIRATSANSEANLDAIFIECLLQSGVSAPVILDVEANSRIRI